MPPVFYYGFGPRRLQAVNAHVNKYSKPADVLRIGPNAGIIDVRRAQHFVRAYPTDDGSSRRSLVISAYGIDRRAQNALLVLLEDPQQTASVILQASTTRGLLPTVLSRCVLVDKRPGDFASSVKALMDDGLSANRSAEVATALDKGLSMDLAPTSADQAQARRLLEVVVKKDLDMAALLLKVDYGIGVLIALRLMLLERQLFRLLMLTYSGVGLKGCLIKFVREGMQAEY